MTENVLSSLLVMMAFYVFSWKLNLYSSRSITHMSNLGFVFINSYVSGDDRCIIPDYGTATLTHSNKQSLIQQSVTNAETYMFNPSAVATGQYLLTHKRD